jgi:small GTP-binding protein
MARNFLPKTDTPSVQFLEAKIVLLGDTGVGKTSLALRFTQDVFQPRINPTIGASFLMKNMEVDDQKLKIQIWDTAGQERFRSLAPMYYRGASAAIVVYDICSPQSFSKVKEWVNELKLNIQDEIIMVIVGNKVDKAEKSRQIRVDVGREYAYSVNASFVECSAKTNEGVEELFTEVAHKLVQNRKNIQKVPISTLTGNVGSEQQGQSLNVASNNFEKGGDVINDSCC